MIVPPEEALAEALHDNDEMCAEQASSFAECIWRTWDLEHAAALVVSLRKLGWRLERDPAGTIPMFEETGT